MILCCIQERRSVITVHVKSYQTRRDVELTARFARETLCHVNRESSRVNFLSILVTCENKKITEKVYKFEQRGKNSLSERGKRERERKRSIRNNKSGWGKRIEASRAKRSMEIY